MGNCQLKTVLLSLLIIKSEDEYLVRHIKDYSGSGTFETDIILIKTRFKDDYCMVGLRLYRSATCTWNMNDSGAKVQ